MIVRCTDNCSGIEVISTTTESQHNLQDPLQDPLQDRLKVPLQDPKLRLLGVWKTV